MSVGADRTEDAVADAIKTAYDEHEPCPPMNDYVALFEAQARAAVLSVYGQSWLQRLVRAEHSGSCAAYHFDAGEHISLCDDLPESLRVLALGDATIDKETL